MGETDESRVDELRERIEELSIVHQHGENPVKRWILLDGARPTVSVVLLVVVFLVIVISGIINPFQFRRLLTETTTVQTLFNTLLSGIILLVSIVVSINSVFLSQEITSLGSQEERIENSLEFRQQIESFIDRDVSPAEPSKFLAVIVETIRQQAQLLEETVAQTGDESFHEQVDEFVDSVAAQANAVDEQLEDNSTQTFDVLLAGLNYNYSWQMYTARRLQKRNAESVSDAVEETFDNLLDSLQYFATGREYFKSLYYELELANLSSSLLYVSLPAIVFTSYVLLAIDTGLVPDVRFLDVSPLLLFVSFAYTIALTPFVILTAYTLRAATLAKRTVAAGPFIIRSSNIDETVDWNENE